ncbi:10052_t:CDS:1, partial [Racocetra persica]
RTLVVILPLVVSPSSIVLLSLVVSPSLVGSLSSIVSLSLVALFLLVVSPLPVVSLSLNEDIEEIFVDLDYELVTKEL